MDHSICILQTSKRRSLSTLVLPPSKGVIGITYVLRYFYDSSSILIGFCLVLKLLGVCYEVLGGPTKSQEVLGSPRSS